MCCSGVGFSARPESKHPEGALGRGASGFSRATWQKEGFQGFFMDMKIEPPFCGPIYGWIQGVVGCSSNLCPEVMQMSSGCLNKFLPWKSLWPSSKVSKHLPNTRFYILCAALVRSTH